MMLFKLNSHTIFHATMANRYVGYGLPASAGRGIPKSFTLEMPAPVQADGDASAFTEAADITEAPLPPLEDEEA